MNHAARREKEQRLEERVRHQVKNAGGERANATREKHVAQLADGRVCENLLDIRLHQADGRCKERRRAADNRHDQHRRRRMRKQNVRTRHYVDTGGDHGRRVNQSADRCRPFHRVRQPHIQR